MPTIIDRLLGRDIPQKAVLDEPVKAATGSGVLAWQQDVPLWRASSNPRRLMKQAQELYHQDLVIRALERRVSTAAANLPWHLEDENDDEIIPGETSDTVALEVLDWLERPQSTLPLDMRQTGAGTRRDLWFLTSKHSGLCGSAFWYLDRRRGVTNLALATLYINPARMYPKQNERGFLVGWQLDADEDGNGGVPLELAEVRHFVFEPPDFGHYGIGLVESGGMAAQLSSVIERHATQVIGGGARLAGLMSPKTGNVVSDDQWAAAARDWRNIQSDPESAKRLHILRSPVDFTRTAATMSELAVETLYHMTRDDKMALWGVPASQVPFPTPAGLNSGTTKGFDEAVFYQGAVHDRVNILKDVIQGQILDPIKEAGGPALTLIFHEPEFDDQTPLFDRAQKSRDLPLTANERRAQINLDPLPDVDAKGEPLGTAIWLPVGLTLVNAGPDENGNLVALPEPPPPPPQLVPPANQAPPDQTPPVPAKASLGGLRNKVDKRFVAALQTDMLTALRAQAKAVAARIRSRGSAVTPDKPGTWWDDAAETSRLRRAIEPHNLRVAQLVVETAPKLLTPKKADDFEDTVLAFVKRKTGERILGINQTTKDAISDLIRNGFEQGLGPSEVADQIEASTPFDEARAEMVARTESMLAYNEATLSSYREFGVTEVQAIDGDGDEECAARDGQTFPIAEAFAIEDHPNGTLDWSPVI